MYIEVNSKLEIIGLLLIALILLELNLKELFYGESSTLLEVVYSLLVVQILDKQLVSKVEVIKDELYIHILFILPLQQTTFFSAYRFVGKWSLNRRIQSDSILHLKYCSASRK